MHVDTLTLFVERLKQESAVPKYEDGWPWLGLCVGLLVALIPGDFTKDFLDVPAAWWGAGASLAAFAAGVKAASAFFKAWTHREERNETAEEAVRKILDQIIERRKQARQLSSSVESETKLSQS